jgi:hypothetical protein
VAQNSRIGERTMKGRSEIHWWGKSMPGNMKLTDSNARMKGGP